MKVLAGCLATALLALSPAASYAAKPKTYTFSFDGFCDGMSLTVSDQAVVGTSTGCFSGNVDVGFVANFKGADPQLTMGGRVLMVSSTNFGGTASIYIINLKTQTWADYLTSDGVTQHMNFTGTLTFAGPSPDRVNLPSTASRNHAR